MELKACIFDMDGVIIDSADFHFQAWKKLAAVLRIDLKDEHSVELKGISRIDTLEKILSKGNLFLDNDTKHSLLEKKNTEYLQSISSLNKSDLLPGVLDLLEECKSAGIKVALGSSSKNAEIVLEKTGIKSYFQEVVDGNRVKFSKPDPEVFLKAAAGLKVSPKEVIVFEDAVNGVKGAKAGGFYCVGVGDEQELAQADHVVEGLFQVNLDKLRAIFGG